ncbi:hypothetical protein [Ferruginibacter sp.]|nr:hypothetical protein [Ferruginibacter sp.]
MKKSNKLYDYLESTGILVNGSVEDILRAKKQYWISVRKEWQYQKRKKCKSYTVFFTHPEHKALINALKYPKSSVTAFIKLSALQMAKSSSRVDKITMGQVREAFFEAYNSIEMIDINTKEKQLIEILERFVNLEQKILSLLCS